MKHLSLALKKSGGRNNRGRITSFHIGGGHKQRYRLVDFNRQLANPAIIRTIEKDPSRSSFISLICYRNGTLSYMLTPEAVKIGDIVLSSQDLILMTGSTITLKYIPLGLFIHNVQFGLTGKLIRAAGTWGQILKKTLTHALIKLPSNKKILVNLNNNAVLGKLANNQHAYKKLYKAGRTRWAGITPTVRGVAMNPVDHPMGGKTHGKLHRTPWGRITKGPKTSRNKA